MCSVCLCVSVCVCMPSWRAAKEWGGEQLGRFKLKYKAKFAFSLMFSCPEGGVLLFVSPHLSFYFLRSVYRNIPPVVKVKKPILLFFFGSIPFKLCRVAHRTYARFRRCSLENLVLYLYVCVYMLVYCLRNLFSSFSSYQSLSLRSQKLH